MNELLIRALGGAIWVLANRHNKDCDQWEQYAAAAEADLCVFIAAGRFEADQSDQDDTVSDLLAAMPSMPHPGGKLIEVVAHYEDGSKQTINGHVVSSAMAKARGDQVDGPARQAARGELEPLELYEVAGKLGPWARNGAQGERFLDVGMQGRPEYLLISKAERDGGSWRYVRVTVKESEHIISTYPKFCSTNTYKRVGARPHRPDVITTATAEGPIGEGDG